MIVRVVLAAALLVPLCAQPARPAPAAIATNGTGTAVEPRFETAWTDLSSALWMLTHSDAVSAKDPHYQQAVHALYGAIGAMDDGITDSRHRSTTPTAARDGHVRLHAALNFLTAADRLLAPPSGDKNAEPLRARALMRTREALTATKALVAACRC
jgi:hypothetical protein